MSLGLTIMQAALATPFVVWAVLESRPAVRARATREFIADLPVTISPDLRARLERRVTSRRVLGVLAMGATLVVLATIQWHLDGEVLLFAYLAVTAAGALGRMTPAVVRSPAPQGAVRVAAARTLRLRDVVAPRWAAVSVVALLAFVAVEQRLQMLHPAPEPWVDLSVRTRMLIMLLVPLAIGLLCTPLVLRAVRGSGPATDQAELTAVITFRLMAVADVFTAASTAVLFVLITLADPSMLLPWDWTAETWPLQAGSLVLWIFVGIAIGGIASPATGRPVLRRSTSPPRLPMNGRWVDTPDFPEIKEQQPSKRR